MRRFFSVLLMLWFGFNAATNCSAQPTTSTGNINQTTTDGAGAGGGNSVADFTELMDLIQTVVPGAWDVGDDTILPYANGVWIDANSKLIRPTRDAEPIARFELTPEAESKLETTLGPELQRSEKLRWVSLTRLAKLVSDDSRRGKKLPIGGLLVGGLSKIVCVRWDASLQEWFIGGPAGNFFMTKTGDLISLDTSLPPVLLEDLLTVAPLVLEHRGPFGCTIDPSEGGLATAGKLLADANVVRELQSKPDAFAKKLGNAVGPQTLRLINLPPKSPTGLALLMADEHMKRLGLELAEARVAPSYWTYYESFREQQYPPAMVRWWFALADSPAAKLKTNDEKSLAYFLDRSTVKVMSQNQWMKADGERFDVATDDKAADSFAAGFTAALADTRQEALALKVDQPRVSLQQKFPIYGRLRNIFDLSVCFSLIAADVEAGRAEALQFPADLLGAAERSSDYGTVDSLVAVKKLHGKSVSAIVTGGVLVDPADLGKMRAAGENVPSLPDVKLDEIFKFE